MALGQWCRTPDPFELLPVVFLLARTPEETADFAAALRKAGLRFQLEHHQDRDVFLLPKADHARHHEMKLDLWQEED